MAPIQKRRNHQGKKAVKPPSTRSRRYHNSEVSREAQPSPVPVNRENRSEPSEQVGEEGTGIGKRVNRDPETERGSGRPEKNNRVDPAGCDDARSGDSTIVPEKQCQPARTVGSSSSAGNQHEDEGSRGTSLENASPAPLLSRRNRRMNTMRPRRIHNGGIQSSSPIPSGSGNRSRSSTTRVENDLRSAFNQVKANLLETQRDKRVYASTVLSQTDKIKRLERELQQKNMQVLGLEACLAKKGTSTNRKGNIWSLQSLESDGISEYQGIFLALGRLGSREVTYLITESFLEFSNANVRRRDWRGSATSVSAEMAKKAVQFVKLPDAKLAIPTCVMVRALERKFFSNIFKTPSGFLRECLKNVLSSPAASFMTEEEKKLCESKIPSHRPTNQKFRTMISDGIGNRKKVSRNTYLRSLGYNNAVRPVSKNDPNSLQQLRATEKEDIVSRCVSSFPSGISDTSYWRTAQWRALCCDVSDPDITTEMLQAEEALDSSDAVDCWFLNEPSRRAFMELRGYPAMEISDTFTNDVSILTLARADASMTTMLKMITVGGKGGVRNNGFIESFRTLLPVAMETIIKELWMDISDRAEHELHPYIGNSEQNDDDPFGNTLRDYTIVLVDPYDNHVYVLASAKYIQEKICSWYGSVKDAHIGRCKRGEDAFTMIDKQMKFDDDEISDLDSLPDEEIAQVDIEDEDTPESSQQENI